MRRKILKRLAGKMGYELVRASARLGDMEAEFKAVYERCEPYTMTSVERMYSLYKAVEYVSQNGIRGDVVECGVWRGGSSMLCALTLLGLGDTDRRIFLYDTYEGMSDPGEQDVEHTDRTAHEAMIHHGRERLSDWCRCSLVEAKRNLASTGYPADMLVFVEGKVEETIPGTVPEAISVLRLDTDWYDSTYHELRHLFPLLSRRGALVLDDYGHWKGAREAVDSYFVETETAMLLNRADYTGRIGVKMD